MNKIYDVIIVGAGFTGLSAGYELTKKGYSVLIIESDSSAGGLAGIFKLKDGISLEKFYHHWFNSDKYIKFLIDDLGIADKLVKHSTKTGIYFNGSLWNLSKPLDLLKFSPLKIFDRLRLGFLIFQVRMIKDWKPLEKLTIREWLEPLCGKNVYKVVWEPLIKAKFSTFSEKINAVWMWKKLVLRGSTRNKSGNEELFYFKGGFGNLANYMVEYINSSGGHVEFNQQVLKAISKPNNVEYLETSNGIVKGRSYLFTPALPIISNFFDSANPEWKKKLNSVNYLGNICLVLRLKKRLSDTYWTNVNDPGFPFVGIIEHTNFDPPKNYKGTHIAYLSKYVSKNDPIWNYSDQKYINYAWKYLEKMFPHIKKDWLIEANVWRANFAQPVTELKYSEYVPDFKTPYSNAYIATMAQIYPEDRGTNYSVRDGFMIASKISNYLSKS